MPHKSVPTRALLLSVCSVCLYAGCSDADETPGTTLPIGDASSADPQATESTSSASNSVPGASGTPTGTSGAPNTSGTDASTGGTTNAGGAGAGLGGTTGSSGTTNAGGTTSAGGSETGGAGSSSGGAGAGGGAAPAAAGASGSGGSGGVLASGGTNNSGAGGGAPEPNSPGDISIDNPVPGFASVSGGTTGGGTDLSTAITVNSMSALQSAASGSNPAIILVEPGNYSGALEPGANKTIIGVAPGVAITGRINISGEDRNNIIIRNIAVQGEPCNSYDECADGDDAVYVGNGAHHVWLDHLDISDGQDGNCDMTRGSDFITVSWTRFYYTYEKEHRFSNLIAGSDDEPESVGKLRITYMNSHWGERVDSRQPRGRFGNVHMLNNHHDTGGSQIHGVGVDMALIAENSVYDENRSIWTDMGSPRGWRGVGNIGSGSDLNGSTGTVFEIPYDYTPLPASEVVAAVTASECGAGNTCTLRR